MSWKAVQSVLSETKQDDWLDVNLDNSGSPAEKQHTISTNSHTTHAIQGTNSIDSQPSTESNNTGIIVAASIAGGVLVILIILFSWSIRR